MTSVGMGIPDARSRATVFDLDDTLIASGAGWDTTCATFTAAHGHTWTEADSAVLHGNGHWTTYVSALCGGIPTSRVADDCTQIMIGALAGGDISLLPGAARLTAEAARYGPLAVASASPRRFVQAALAHFELDDRFPVVVCGENVSQPKPAPDPYLRAAEELRVDPRDCVAVEDSPNGIRAAHAAGMTVLAIPRPGDPLPADIGALTAHQAGDAVEAVALLPLLHRTVEPHAETPRTVLKARHEHSEEPFRRRST